MTDKPPLPSTGGLTVGVSTGRVPQDVPVCTDNFAVVNESGEMVLYECGHTAPPIFMHDLYGDVVELTDAALAQRQQCGRCLLAHVKANSIRCARCGRAILGDDAVAVYDYSAEFKTEWTTVVDGVRVLGCMRRDCAPSGAYFGGHWDGHQFVPMFEGGGSVASETMRTGAMIIVSDVDAHRPSRRRR